MPVSFLSTEQRQSYGRYSGDPSADELEFVADNPGFTLFHCHQQLHTDFGFMELLKYA